MTFEQHLHGLAEYGRRWPGESATVERIAEFLSRRPDAFERGCAEGHVTASAWVTSDDGASVLLVRHRKLGMWLQPGGHTDGEPDTLTVALREAREESGLESLRAYVASAVVPFDIDIHQIPACSSEPAHLHYDLRHLLFADPSEKPVSSHESEEVRWVSLAQLETFTAEESVLRMSRKASLLVSKIAALD
ncbi:MAG: NUDIX hydrolase [Acidobacteriota bacterium]|nr:NUDIX hydrolase [Acidobacteriota bacterium]